MTLPVFLQRSGVMRAAQIVVCLSLFGVLWHAADGREAVQALAKADPWWLLAAVAALSLQTILSALRWRLTAGQLGIRFDVRHAVREYYLAQIVNQSLPGGMVGDAGRAVRARGQAGLIKSGQSVVFERLAGQLAMFLLLAMAFPVTWLVSGGLDWPQWLALPVSLLILGGLLAPPLAWALTRLPGAAGRGASGLWDSLWHALAARRVLPRQIALGLGTTACNLAAFAFCAQAIGASLPLIAVVTLVPLILFTMLIPVSVSGWGLREGAAAALFPLAGATATQGLATSIAFGLVFLVTVLPGVIPLWRKPKRQTVETRA